VVLSSRPRAGGPGVFLFKNFGIGQGFRVFPNQRRDGPLHLAKRWSAAGRFGPSIPAILGRGAGWFASGRFRLGPGGARWPRENRELLSCFLNSQAWTDFPLAGKRQFCFAFRGGLSGHRGTGAGGQGGPAGGGLIRVKGGAGWRPKLRAVHLGGCRARNDSGFGLPSDWGAPPGGMRQGAFWAGAW